MSANSDALLTSNKALSIIFIILICLVNFCLIYKQARKPLFYQNAKWMTIISLAIGDVILALFPLVVMAKQYFNPFEPLPCRLGIAYIAYINYLIHFVYGLGVIALGAEVLLRQKLQVNVCRTVTAFAMSASPWVLGLIIILPLCFANVDYDRCYLTQSSGALLGVSVLLPASLALVATLLLNCMNRPQSPPKQSAAYFQQSVSDSQQSIALLEPNHDLHQPQIHGNVNYSSYPFDNDLYTQYPSDPPPAYDALCILQPNPQNHYIQHGIVNQCRPSQSNAEQPAPDVIHATNQSTSIGTDLNSNRPEGITITGGHCYCLLRNGRTVCIYRCEHWRRKRV